MRCRTLRGEDECWWTIRWCAKWSDTQQQCVWKLRQSRELLETQSARLDYPIQACNIFQEQNTSLSLISHQALFRNGSRQVEWMLPTAVLLTVCPVCKSKHGSKQPTRKPRLPEIDRSHDRSEHEESKPKTNLVLHVDNGHAPVRVADVHRHKNLVHFEHFHPAKKGGVRYMATAKGAAKLCCITKPQCPFRLA